MAEYVVSTLDGEISFAPSTTVQEIIQNVRTIITTVKGSVPLDREFGIDGSIVDKPLPVAQAMVSRDVVSAIKRYEPRAKVKKVEYSDSTGAIDGILRPLVRIEIND